MASEPVSSPIAPSRANGLLCPVCRVDLVLSERQGIEIDYCPQCRGVWLDRGELDKIIERNAAYESQARPTAPPVDDPSSRAAPSGPWGYDERRGGGHHGGGHGGRGGFLGGLFRH